MAPKILIIEDDQRLASMIGDYLQNNDFQTAWHDRGDDVEQIIAQFNPDLIILDVMLPGKTGLDVCRDIRTSFLGKILIMTAIDDDIKEIIGLELGADDYLTKPVEPRLLLARIRALLRRTNLSDSASDINVNQKMIKFNGLEINIHQRSAVLNKQALDFTTAEFDLLYLLATHAGQVLSRDDILNSLRGIDFDGLDRSIDARISRLRKKLQDDPDNPKWIKTIRGKGYLFAFC